ncbi:hypothetical protein [Novipirellula aureliae]|uniref:hypothetical protein n=1 Tax=Novipirellula aureliae TaxID=2527966 RepID=UPI0011B628AA|nr:hypothetical protein [Novipirellula aureliae]
MPLIVILIRQTDVSGGCFWRLFLAVVSGGCFWRLFLAVVSGGCFWRLFLAVVSAKIQKLGLPATKKKASRVGLP